MFWNIATYELSYRMKRISTHVYFGIMFALGFLIIQAVGGAFDSFNVAVAGAGSALAVNSPYVTFNLITALSLFGVIITASFVGQAIYRDFGTDMHPLVFTTPVSKVAYLGGRFTGAIIGNLYIFLGIGLGLMIGSFMPWLEAEFFGDFNLTYYLHPYTVMVIPNLLFTGAIFFALAALTRAMLPNYIGGVVLLMGYMLAGVFISDVENEVLAALIDPFGGNAFSQLTQYWTLAEQSTQLVPLEGTLLWNRLLWMGVGLLIFGVMFSQFRFAHMARERRSRKGKKTHEGMRGAVHALNLKDLPMVEQTFSIGMEMKQFVTMTKREFWNIVTNVYFYAIVGSGVIFLIFSSIQVGQIFGTSTFPVTYQMLGTLGGTFVLFMLIIITFYAGELVWNEREMKINQIHDSLPIPNWIPFASKFSALSLVCAVLLTSIMIVGMASQVLRGYFNVEVGLYVQQLFGMQLLNYILLCVLALTVQTLVNHKYMGHVVMIVYYLFSAFQSQLGMEHSLFDFGGDLNPTYSDMNDYGHFNTPFVWFKVYWAGFAILLATLTNLFWVRGGESNWKWRLQLFRQRLTLPALAQMGIGVLIFLSVGGFIFYNTNILNEYSTTYESQLATAEYEKKYKRFDGIPQPRITDVYVDVDIHPYERDVYAQGRFTLMNKSDAVIDSVHIRMPSAITINDLSFEEGHRQVLADADLGYYIYELDTPLQPGDTLHLNFDIAAISEGFADGGGGTQVVYNGTFFNSGIFPSIGYSAGAELSQDDTRRKFDLPPKERMAAVDDSVARMNTYISNDADWITYETVVSTAPDQIAIAPGYLQREWEEDGRRYFHYKMDSRILNFYAYLSASYTVARDTWISPDSQEVALEIYYYEGHPYNIDRMMEAMKKSLTYFSTKFSPYQHRQARIIEFPRYATFAQAFPNTIPYSESIGFIARVDDEDDIDYPFYVTAHEIAHQWWAHQVIGGNVQGSTLLSESLSQYSALMVMEQEYGEEHMRRFLRYELDQYLQGRAFERKKELPLLLVENQQYIHYRKGSLVMYALKDYIGEDSVNVALSRYIDAVAFQEPPYTNSLEFLSYIRAVTPDSLDYLLTDLFETITLYENYVEDATYTLTPDSLYEVSLTLLSKKLRADSLGVESEVALNDWIDIGIFGEERIDGEREEVPLYFQKHRITSDTTRITITVDQEPKRAGIDPYNKLIDRNSGDNVKAVRED